MSSSQDRDPKIFPDELQGLHDTIITCLNLTNDFLCFGTDVSFENLNDDDDDFDFHRRLVTWCTSPWNIGVPLFNIATRLALKVFSLISKERVWHLSMTTI